MVTMNLISCSSTKKLAATHSTISKQAKIKTFSPDIPQFDTWNIGKCKVSLTMNDRNITVPASLRIVKDSLISLSIQPLLGIEMYRAELTPDSISLIDRGNHMVFTTSYEFFTKKFGIPIHFSDIQAILTDNLLKNTTTPEVNAQPEDSLTKWMTSRNELKIEYAISQANQLVQTQITKNDSQAIFQCIYAQFVKIGQQLAPTSCAMSVSSNNRHAEMTLTYQNVNVNTGIHSRPLNTSHYQRVSLDQILPF